jgi:tetratricopeptide (TPR) repeat protein
MKHSDDLAHLADCSACRQRLAGNVITFDATTRRAREREFIATASRLERERESAGDVVDRILRETPVDEWPRLAEVPEFRNNAALEQMSEQVRRRLHRKPTEALAIANLSASIAESLPPSQYPPVILAQLRANAWKDRASTLRYLARYDEAIEAADRGEETLASFAGLAHDRAIVRMVKGIVYFQTGRLDEAATVLAECRQIFGAYNDEQRLLQAGIMQACVLYEKSQYVEASQLFSEMIRQALALHDLESQARIHNNLGYCATHLGNFVQANIHFSEAIAKFTDLGFTAEVPRTKRGAGLVLIARGQTASGLTHLHAARRDFIAVGMIEEAGLCALRIAAALVDRGDDKEALALTQEVINEFTAAGLDERATAAIVRLRDAIDVDDATAETVRTVHAFVESLDDFRETLL